MTPSAARALAAKAKSLQNKQEENKRAYQRRKERLRLQELHRLSGIESYLTRQSENNKTPDAAKGMNKRNRKLESVHQNIPQNICIPIREYIDTPEDRAEVAAIIAKGRTNNFRAAQ